FVDTFKVLLDNMETEGWYKRSHLWNMIFLQRIDGSFELSRKLASMLHAGEPEQDLMENPLAPHSPETLQQSIPDELWEAMVGGEELTSEAQAEVGDLWATILVVTWLEGLPYAWTENPEDHPKEQITLRSRAHMYIMKHCEHNSKLTTSIDSINRTADLLLTQWEAEHEAHAHKVYILLKKHPESVAEHFQQFSDSANRFIRSTRRERLKFLHKKRDGLFKRMLRSVRWILRAHPLIGIAMVGPTEPFSRSERILIQANTFIMMLTFSMWFFYTKSLNCCRDFREYVSCPSHLAVREPCLGYTYCLALMDSSDDDYLPEELHGDLYECNHFPEDTYLGRAYAILVMVTILTPVNLVLSQCFIIAASASIPSNWGTYVPKRAARLFGPFTMLVVQTIVLMAYVLFFNFRKFNRGMASAVVAALSIALRSRQVRRFFRSCYEAVCWVALKMWEAYEAAYAWAVGGIVENEETRMAMHLVSQVESSLQMVAYTIIVVSWSIIAMVLLTYSLVIRELMGAESEQQVIMMWLITLFFDQFGIECFKIILIRGTVSHFMKKLEGVILGHSPMHKWYESHVLQITHSLHEEQAREEEAADDDFNAGNSMDMSFDGPF
ncbi:hypothetical protein CYMTET_17710, partial [Cymbomonas tetramitiformis]